MFNGKRFSIIQIINRFNNDENILLEDIALSYSIPVDELRRRCLEGAYQSDRKRVEQMISQNDKRKKRRAKQQALEDYRERVLVLDDDTHEEDTEQLTYVDILPSFKEEEDRLNKQMDRYRKKLEHAEEKETETKSAIKDSDDVIADYETQSRKGNGEGFLYPSLI